MSKVIVDTLDKIKESVDLICNPVASTLGPAGKNVLTVNEFGEAHLTKDGITVAKNIKNDDPVINGIINTIREASSNTAKTSGDGTTTSLVFTKALFDNGVKAIEQGCNPTVLKHGMNKALEDVLNYIDSNSEKINIEDEKLAQVAYISANNDTEVGDIAVEAVRKSGINGTINIEDSPTYDTYIKVINGFTFDRGYISSHFSNNSKIEFENPLIFISEVELNKETTLELLTYSNKVSRPLVIIAPDFNEAIFMLLYKNYKANIVNVCPIKAPGFAGNRRYILEDLTDYTNATLYTKNINNAVNYLGQADKAIIHQDSTNIINYNAISERSLNKVHHLRSLIEDDPNSPLVESYKKRITALNGYIANIYVGATTELELKEKKDRIEDAVCAVQTALKDGISEGGGFTFIQAYNHLQKNICCAGYKVVVDSLLAPFKQLCLNSDLELEIPKDKGYNFKTDVWENLKEAGVIDPTLVLKNAITNSVGIISNLLTTSYITYVN